MKKDIKKSMMPATVAPVQRETAAAATASRCEVNAITAQHMANSPNHPWGDPFAGDDAE